MPRSANRAAGAFRGACGTSRSRLRSTCGPMSAVPTRCCRSWRATGRDFSTASRASLRSTTSACRPPASTPSATARKTCSWFSGRRSPRRRPYCSSSRNCSPPSVFLRQRLSWKQRFVEAELGEVADPHRVEDAVEVVDFVLHDTSVEIRRLALEWAAVLVKAAIAQTLVARHDAAHAGHGQAAFPALLHLRVEQREDRIDEDGVVHRLLVGIAGIG